jgi:hypothetical protein
MARTLLRSVGTVRSARRALSALALIISVIGTAAVPAFAGLGHPVCTLKHHDCGQAARIGPCCCGDQGDASNPTGPVESHVTLHAPMTMAPADLASTPALADSRHLVRPHTGPARAAPPDLPTLFASLLI